MPNRYVLQGIAADLEGGADIAVFIPRYASVASMLHQITEYTDETYTQVLATSRQILHESGGIVTVLADSLQARGMDFDVIVVPYGSASEFPFFLTPRVEIIEY